MVYCPTCQRPLNNTVSCPGCGSLVREPDDLPTQRLPVIRAQARRLNLHMRLQQPPQRPETAGPDSPTTVFRGPDGLGPAGPGPTGPGAFTPRVAAAPSSPTWTDDTTVLPSIGPGYDDGAGRGPRGGGPGFGPVKPPPPDGPSRERRRTVILVSLVTVPVLAVGGIVFAAAGGSQHADAPPGTVTAAGGATSAAAAKAPPSASVIQLPTSASPSASPDGTASGSPSGAQSSTGAPSASASVTPGGVVMPTIGQAGTVTVTASQYTATAGTGTEQNQDTGGGEDVGWITNGSWLEYANVAFGSGDSILNARIASNATGTDIGVIQFRLDAQTATPFATINVSGTGGWQDWITVESPASPMPSGTHTLYVTFAAGTGGDFVNVNWFQFS
jgi:hypothetical protein